MGSTAPVTVESAFVMRLSVEIDVKFWMCALKFTVVILASVTTKECVNVNLVTQEIDAKISIMNICALAFLVILMATVTGDNVTVIPVTLETDANFYLVRAATLLVYMAPAFVTIVSVSVIRATITLKMDAKELIIIAMEIHVTKIHQISSLVAVLQEAFYYCCSYQFFWSF